MSEFSITEVVDAFYYTKANKPDFQDQYYDLAELQGRIESYLAQIPGIEVAEKAEPIASISKRFLSSLIQAGCFNTKEIPFSEPVYKFQAKKYDAHRVDFLNSNAVYKQAKDYKGYFTRAFEGYALATDPTRLPETGDTVAKNDLLKVDWREVADRQTPASVAEISSKITELATTIQQADINDGLRSKLLARVRAVDALLKADEPEWPEIVNLLNYPYLTSFLNAYAILDIILGLSG